MNNNSYTQDLYNLVAQIQQLEQENRIIKIENETIRRQKNKAVAYAQHLCEFTMSQISGGFSVEDYEQQHAAESVDGDEACKAMGVPNRRSVSEDFDISDMYTEERQGRQERQERQERQYEAFVDHADESNSNYRVDSDDEQFSGWDKFLRSSKQDNYWTQEELRGFHNRPSSAAGSRFEQQYPLDAEDLAIQQLKEEARAESLAFEQQYMQSLAREKQVEARVEAQVEAKQQQQRGKGRGGKANNNNKQHNRPRKNSGRGRRTSRSAK